MNVRSQVGQTFGQYELRELLGVGGMGAVYRAYQSSLQRAVAVKVLSPELIIQPDYIERFYREARIAAALEHTHIVPVYDYGVQGEISYVVMRLLTEGTLTERLAQQSKTGQPLPSLGEISELIKQLASALDYAHNQGVIHRDIKPNNVMFDNQGNAYLVDFGIAKLLVATRMITTSGVVMGTPLFMSPEQWRSEDVTPATDQYALGVMTYALLTGRLPFESDTPHGLMYKHLNEIPTPPQVFRPDMPVAVASVLERAMAKQGSDRFPTVTAFSQAFEDAVAGGVGEQTSFFTAPVRRTKPPALDGASLPGRETTDLSHTISRHPAVWTLGVVTVTVVLLMLAVFLSGRNQGGRKTDLSDGRVGTAAAATITPPLTEIPDLDITANALLALQFTETADGWTGTPSPTTSEVTNATPTPDLPGTAGAIAVARMTATADAFAHDIPTATLTPTGKPVLATQTGAAESGSISGQIMFSSWLEGTGRMYLINADGTNLARLAPKGILDVDSVYCGSWSPDGKAIAYTLWSGSPSNSSPNVWTMEADGSNPIQVTRWAGGIDFSGLNQVRNGLCPRWSPDGSLIAYTYAWSEGLMTNYESSRVVTANGADDRWLIGDKEKTCNDPSWSPDSKYIVCSSWYLYIVTNSSEPTMTQLSVQGENPAWSPDGGHIAYNSGDQIWVAKADGSDPVQVTADRYHNTAPVWSLDGHFIAFNSDRDGNSQVYVMNVDGSGIRRLTNDNAADSVDSWR